MGCVVWSVKTPVAANCCVVPAAMLGVGGVTPMDTTVAGVTVSVVLPLWPSKLAVTVAVPGTKAKAAPVAASTVATAVLEEVQAAWVVTSVWLWSL
jgi:hypothetical protein